jgi:hypothetical protein
MTTRVQPVYMDWWMSIVRPWDLKLGVEMRGRRGDVSYVDVEEGEEGNGFVALVVFSSFPAEVLPFNDGIHHCVGDDVGV